MDRASSADARRGQVSRDMQVWKMKGWPHQISDGIFIQLESPKPLRSCWFIPLDDKQPQETSNDYKILEPIFK